MKYDLLKENTEIKASHFRFYSGFFIIIILIVCGILCYFLFLNHPLILQSEDKEARKAFEEFVLSYKKLYSSKDEHEYRFSIFQNNFLKIKEMNSQNNKFTVAINHFADLSDEEFSHYYLKPKKNRKLFDPSPCNRQGSNNNYQDVNIDYRKFYPPVKDQGLCGSCWTFSCIGGIEGLYNSKHNLSEKPVSLSEQELMDCSYNLSEYNYVAGCDGGEHNEGYKYVMDHKISHEEDYPYLAIDEDCRNVTTEKISISNRSVIEICHQDYMLTNLMRQPLTTSLSADHLAFRFYSSGIVTHGCGYELDHDVVIVGAGTENNIPYWIIRNSWGRGWGEGGYIRIQRYEPIHPGVCGEALDVGYPII